jgi:hypothetical protein
MRYGIHESLSFRLVFSFERVHYAKKLEANPGAFFHQQIISMTTENKTNIKPGDYINKHSKTASTMHIYQ